MNTEHRISNAYASFVCKYSILILIGLSLFAAVTIPIASKLELRANFLALLPDDMESVEQLNKLTESIGGTSVLVVAFEGADETTVEAVGKRFIEKAKFFTDTDVVDNRTDTKIFDSRKLLFLTTRGLESLNTQIDDVIGYHRRKNNPFFVNLLDEAEPAIDPDSLELEEKAHKIGSYEGKEGDHFMSVVLIKPLHPISEFDPSERMFAETRAAFEEIKKDFSEPVTMAMTGPYKTRYDEYQGIKSDFVRTGVLTVFLVLLITVLFFQMKRAVILAFFPLSFGILFTAAYAQLMIGYLNLISAFMLAILFGLGIDFAIHLLVSFRDERLAGRDTKESLTGAIESVGVPSMTSALTTSIAFFSLTISEFNGFSHFGLIAGLGILLCFASVFLGLPSMILLCEKIKPMRPPKPHRILTGLPSERIIVRSILIIGIAFSIFSILQVPKVEFEYDFRKMQEKNSEAVELGDRISSHFGVVLNPVILMTKDRDQAVRATNQISAYIDAHPDTNIDFAASIKSYVPKNQDEKFKLMADIDAKLETKARLIEKLEGSVKEDFNELRRQLRAEPMTFEDVPERLHTQYEGSTKSLSVVYIYPKESLMDGRLAKKFVRELRAMTFEDGITIAGEPVIYADILMILERDTPRAMLISMGIVILLLFIHFRNIKHVLWVITPVLLGFVWLIGTLKLTGLRLNYFNVVILPSILGVGIDNGIHIFHKYKVEKKSTFLEILRHTGKAVVLASLTTMAAFFSIFFAKHQGLSLLGMLGFWGFACCMVTSVVFVPATIEFLDKKIWQPARAKKEMSA